MKALHGLSALTLTTRGKIPSVLRAKQRYEYRFVVDCDVNCHRKCEKLTANLCGVNQRLLVEALATRTTSKRGEL